MKAIILVAGRGRRLRPLTDRCPKPLLPIGDHTILSDCLAQLKALNPEQYVIVVGYRSKCIRSAVGESFEGTSITYVRQPGPSGPAGALYAAREKVDDPFALIYGDSIYRCDLVEPVRRFRRADHRGIVLVDRPASASTGRGRIQLGPDGAITGFGGGAGTKGWKSAGYFVLSPTIFSLPRSEFVGGGHDVMALVEGLSERGNDVAGHVLDGWRVNINIPEDLRRARERLGGR